MPTPITANLLKVAAMSYFRFKRQWMCVDEAMDADVLVDSGKEIIEVEVKVDRHDLVHKERTKWKHAEWMAGRTKHAPNRFYFMVPTGLIQDAKLLVEELNPAYGVMEFDTARFESWSSRSSNVPFEECVNTVRRAGLIHTLYADHLRRGICMRLSSSLIGMMKRQLSGRSVVDAIVNNSHFSGASPLTPDRIDEMLACEMCGRKDCGNKHRDAQFCKKEEDHVETL